MVLRYTKPLTTRSLTVVFTEKIFQRQVTKLGLSSCKLSSLLPPYTSDGVS